MNLSFTKTSKSFMPTKKQYTVMYIVFIFKKNKNKCSLDNKCLT